VVWPYILRSGINVLWFGLIFSGLASMFCGRQIRSVVVRNDIKPLCHTQNTHYIMILDGLSILSVLFVLFVLSVLWLLEMFSSLFCENPDMPVYL
jgi:hypothetical protein